MRQLARSKTWPSLPSWSPHWLRTWFRLQQLRRDLRNLDDHFGPWAAGAEGQRKQVILAEWLLEAKWPETEIAKLESDKLRRQARFWNVVVPSLDLDPDTGHRFIPEGRRAQLRGEISHKRRESTLWWIQFVVIPLIALVTSLTVLVLLFYRLIVLPEGG